MSVANTALETAFLNWISTFDTISHKPESFESLTNGVVLTEFMHNLDPTIFDLSKINRDTQDDWALRFANISYLYEGLEKFYTSVLNKFFDKAYVDIVKVSNSDDKHDLYNLVELVLGAAVQCPNKEVYINAILHLDEAYQNSLMDLIEKGLHRVDPSLEQSATLDPEPPNRPSANIAAMIKALENQEKKLLAKVDELEKENQLFKEKLVEMGQESKDHKIRENEFVFELEKKSEEIRRLLHEREDMQAIADAQDSLEELKNELKLKDHKLDQMDIFIEELKNKHEAQISKLEDEIDKQKKKITDLIKIEGTIHFYEQKYQEYTQMTVKMNEAEEEVQRYKNKVDEVNRASEALQTKFNTYKEKLETEKTNNISLDIELTKKKTEIETLKNEKKKLDIANADLERKLLDQNRAAEMYLREREDNMRHHASNDKAMSELAQQNFLSDDDKQVLSPQNTHTTAALSDSEKEILQQENKILIAKCKQIQIENENLKAVKDDGDKSKEKLEAENNRLKEEISKLKSSPEPAAGSSNNKLEAEVENLKRQLRDAQESTRKKVDGADNILLRDELNEKTKLINQLNEEIVGYKVANDKTKKLENELTKKGDEIKELNEQIETMNGILTEVGDQKEDELKVLAAAIQELALRNLDLEKQVNSRGEIAGSISIPKGNHVPTVVQGGGYKPRK